MRGLFVATLTSLVIAVPRIASAQTTYHLHTEASTTAGLDQLKTAGPDVASVALLTANLKSTSNGEKLIKEFDTQAGIPGVVGAIPSGSTLTFQLSMRKTANVGHLFPRAKVFLNNGSGTALCTATGATEITTTLTKYTITCNTTANVNLVAATRFYLWAGANMTAGSTTTNFMAELDIEGTLNGNTDSQVAIPNALPPPSITSLTPNLGGVGQSVTIAGTNFGATQALGASTVKFFNNKTATPTSWSATSIVAPVPAGATTGNVTVTVAGQASNGVSFTVTPTPTITSLTPTSGPVNKSVVIAGTNFGATQGSSTVKFNGTTASPTTWAATSITAPVPAGATTGPVVVTVNGAASNGVTFTVIPPPTLTSATPSTGHIGDSITVAGNNFLASQGTSTIKFNGTTATPTSWTNTSITAPVPAGATTGNITVTVSNQTSNGLAFTVIPPPALTSATPASAHVGDAVTIAGTSFGATQGTSTLKFNGTTATSTSWTDTSIAAPVPAGATSGDITVTVSNQVSNGLPFTVFLGVYSSVYHLHHEPSSTPGLLQLKGVGPDTGGASYAFLGADLINSGPVSGAVQTFDTQAGDPGVAGVIPAGSNLYFVLWMRKTSAFGVVLPQASIRLNGPSGALLCQATGSNPNQALTTTVTSPYVISCLTAADVVLAPTDRLWVSAGYSMTQGPGSNSMSVELWTEGTQDSSTDSAVVPPALVTFILTNISPAAAPVSANVVLSGFGFGASQGTSTISFNGTAATPTAWSNTSVTAPVPSGATSGPVVITVNGTPTNGVPFTVVPPPTLTSVVPSIAHVGDSVTIAGNNFLSAQGSSTVTFHGTPATPTSWSNTAIAVPVPAGATTGDLVVTVSQASNALPFTVLQPMSIGGTITRVTGGTGIAGATVQALQAGVIIGSATTAANGTYSIPGFSPGMYDVRVFASGFSSELRQGIPATSPTTTVNVALYVPGILSGKVTQADGLTPIAGAAVMVYSGPIQKGTANTNATGDYSVSALHPGSYTAQAASVGYTTSEQSVVVNEAATTTANFSLSGAPSAPVQYAYDALGRLIQVTDPSGASAIYRYDAVGNITAIERPGTNGSSGVAISGFSSASGAIGTTVTIYGTGFTASAGQACVTFNGTTATVTSATATQIVTTVPVGAATGAIAIVAPCGSATSAPATFTVTATAIPTITGLTATPVGAGDTFTVNGTNFDVTPANNRLTVNLTNVQQVTAATSTSLQATVPVTPAVATTGRVSLVTAGGGATSTGYLWVAPPGYVAADVESTGSLSVGDNSVAIATANKVALRAFDGSAGHRVAFNVTGVSSGYAYLNLYGPFGALLGSVQAWPNGFLDPIALPSTATYSVVFDPNATATPTATLTFYDNVPADFTSAIAFETPLTVPDGAPGQNARLTFSGTAGQRLSLEQTGPFNCFTATTSILDPNGASIASTCGGYFLDATNPLTATGTYTILVDPKDANHASTTLTLHSVPADASGSTTIGGAGVVLPMNTPGQNGLVTFAGAAQQIVTVHVTVNNVGRGTLTLKTEAGQQVGQTGWLGGGDFTLANQTLPSAGNYQIVVDPYDVNTGSLTVSVTSP